jgi:hypothetical protein
MKLRIVSDDRDHAILIGDEDDNDIAEFYHSDHATVGQSYETAFALARKLVGIAEKPVAWRWRYPDGPWYVTEQESQLAFIINVNHAVEIEPLYSCCGVSLSSHQHNTASQGE